MENLLAAFSHEMANAVERAAGVTVALHAGHRMAASGVHWQPGVIVAAEHTVRREEEISVTLPNGEKAPAKLAGRDPGTDLAVLRLEAANTLATPTLADTTQARVGQFCLAVGRSRETGPSASLGVLSALAGPWRTWRGGQVDQLIRLDVSLLPGSSGSAVVDAAGQALGVLTAGLSRISGLVLPPATIQRVVDELLTKGHVARGYLGIGLQPVLLPAHLQTKLSLTQARGVILLSVEPGGPAEAAQLLVGDILVSLAGQPVSDPDDVQAALGRTPVGQTIAASLVRGGEMTNVDIIVAERPRRRG